MTPDICFTLAKFDIVLLLLLASGVFIGIAIEWAIVLWKYGEAIKWQRHINRDLFK